MISRSSLLMVSFYFPPRGMGGVQRALKFAKYLPEFGWDVTVIAPSPSRRLQADPTLLADIPRSVRVERVAALDPAAWFAPRVTVRRAAPGWARSVREWLRWPDDKVIFGINALRRVRRLMKSQSFDLLWTTSPPPSVHRVGLALSGRMPWVADFRDPWLARDDDWGPTRWHASFARRLRRRIVRTADRIVAVSDPMAVALDREGTRRPATVIYNGYDEEDFPADSISPSGDGPWTILCPGTLSPHSDPRPIFAAVGFLIGRRPDLQLRLVHVGATLGINPVSLAAEHGVASIFTDHGYLDHRASIRALLKADVIVISVSEAKGFATNIPGRLFEVLRSLRPLVLFGPKDGATGTLVGRLPGCRVVSPSDPRDGAAAIETVMQRQRGAPARSLQSVREFDRRTLAGRLAALCEAARDERLKGRGQ